MYSFPGNLISLLPKKMAYQKSLNGHANLPDKDCSLSIFIRTKLKCNWKKEVIKKLAKKKAFIQRYYHTFYPGINQHLS